MTLFAAIMTSPNFGEVCFLVGFILAVIVVVVRLMVRPVPIDGVVMAAAVAFLALGWLAQ